MSLPPLAIVDLETTGTNPGRDRITEIAVILVDEGRVTEEWSTLINPGTGIPPFIQSLTGISDDMVADAPAFESVAKALLERLGNRTFVAHNARFDMGFLKNAYRRLGHTLTLPSLCTVRLSRALFPEHRRHNLDALIRRHGLECGARHRALGDTRAVYQFLEHLKATRPEALQSAVARITGSPSLPPALPAAQIEDIPDGPGVYIFYGDKGTPLYVGKSVNLRSRVLSHFSGDHRLDKDMRIAQQIRDLEWIETAGELGALLHEAQLVKDLLPIHNRRLRRHKTLAAIRWEPESGRPPEIIQTPELDPDDLPRIFGVFRTRRQAVNAFRKIIDENGLCHRLTGLEKTRGACFSHQIKRCRGACVGKESPEDHTRRLAEALGPIAIETWPFRGRIGIRERHPYSDRVQIHVLDRWCHLATVDDEARLDEPASWESPPRFDLDTYRILSRFLRDHGRDLDILQTL